MSDSFLDEKKAIIFDNGMVVNTVTGEFVSEAVLLLINIYNLSSK